MSRLIAVSFQCCSTSRRKVLCCSQSAGLLLLLSDPHSLNEYVLKSRLMRLKKILLFCFSEQGNKCKIACLKSRRSDLPKSFYRSRFLILFLALLLPFLFFNHENLFPFFSCYWGCCCYYFNHPCSCFNLFYFCF